MLFFILSVNSQEKFDVGSPTNSPFQHGVNIEGDIQNTVNEVTGKIAFSTPLGSVFSGVVSHNLELVYNGQNAFKNGQQTNKYNPTSVVGVGWSLNVPKIIVDNKDTGTRDDDEFYLLNGTTNTKLICTARGNTTNGSVWEFQMEKYAPWKISFYYNDSWGDYWKIVDDKGLTYYYGNPSAGQARDFAIRFGNWIGSTKQSGAASQQTIQWNLYKMEDQWGNNLVFEYDVVSQTMSGLSQTEASYLKKITSSNGANIQLTYGTKNSDEYFEPHQEASEPDAYQERYEKKYLQSVSSYNNSNVLVSTYNLGFTLNGTSLNKKRYLTSLSQTVYNNGLNETLPSQTFDYYYTGDFKGGLKKITYPTGGSVVYNYNNKFLFDNTSNLFETTFTVPSGYFIHSSFVSDKYAIQVLRTNNTVIGSKYQFIFNRFWWNGQKWEWESFTFPHLMEDNNPTNPLIDFQVVFGDDYYGFTYDKGTTADVYLFHLNEDGRTWNYYTSTNKSIGSDSPAFISGNEFVALQSHRGGQLYTYVWNGTSWNYKQISQGAGQYYVAAANNFIISMDEDGGGDMVTSVSYEDNYYLHYLDASKKWVTKSWSATADPYIAGVFNPSYFYPTNSFIWFMADGNPEFLLRWDTNYNLTNIDNVGSFNDNFQVHTSQNNLFSVRHYQNGQPTHKTVRFNGLGWSTSNLPISTSYKIAMQSFGEDIVLFQNHSLYSTTNTEAVGYNLYDPNTNSWVYNPLNTYSSFDYLNKMNAINYEFIVAGNKLYKRSNQGSPTIPMLEIGTLQYDNYFSYSDGLSHTFVKQRSSATTLRDARYYYVSKYDGLLKYFNFGLKSNFSHVNPVFGGYTPFMSPNAIWLKNDGTSQNYYRHRIIDDEVNNTIYDIVVNNIDINDDNGSLRKIQYTYNKPISAPDNSTTFYGEVIIENKGAGNGNIGKVVKIFNDGSSDLSMVGLPIEEIVVDTNNKMVKKTVTTWQKYIKGYSNGSESFYDNYFIRPTVVKEELYFENSPTITTETTNQYNISNGLKTQSSTVDSKNVYKAQSYTYAYQQYSFVNDKNMLSFPYEVKDYVSQGTSGVANVEQSKWINDNGKVYMNENWSGPNTSNLRLNSKISKVESTTGNVLENNNGKGLYNSVLFGYNDLYEVATIGNAKYQDVVNQLDVTYSQLQSLSTSSLKTELLKLYDRLPNASINLTFYDSNGRVISQINERKEESFIYYDTLGRKDYIADADGNVLEKKNYHFSN